MHNLEDASLMHGSRWAGTKQSRHFLLLLSTDVREKEMLESRQESVSDELE